MTTMMSETVHNQIFKIEYALEVFVKHQSKLEFGMGNSVTFPIVIRNQAQQIGFLKSRVGDWMKQEKLPYWEPYEVADTVYCGQAKDAHGNYHGRASFNPAEIGGIFSDSPGGQIQLEDPEAMRLRLEEEQRLRDEEQARENEMRKQVEKASEQKRRQEEKANREKQKAEEKKRREEEARAAAAAEEARLQNMAEIIEAGGLGAANMRVEFDQAKEDGFF